MFVYSDFTVGFI